MVLAEAWKFVDFDYKSRRKMAEIDFFVEDTFLLGDIEKEMVNFLKGILGKTLVNKTGKLIDTQCSF